jgi:hypothetical protein
MSYKKGHDINDLEDLSSDYESDVEDFEISINKEEIVSNIRESLFNYIKDSCMPIAEYLTIESMEAFIDYTNR